MPTPAGRPPSLDSPLSFIRARVSPPVALLSIAMLGALLLVAGPGLASSHQIETHRYNFDGRWDLGPGGPDDRRMEHNRDGSLGARMVSIHGGHVGVFPLRGRNNALGFPGRLPDGTDCTGTPSPGTCEGAYLEIAGADDRFDPGDNEIGIFTTVRVTPNEVTGGMNLVQKGTFDAAGGQWKMQLDDGVPSCRFADDDGTVAFPVALASIADGQWHYIFCRTYPDRAELTVDGRKYFALAEGGTGDLGRIDNDSLVTIGGFYASSFNRVNDQFTGDMDNVGINIIEAVAQP